MLEQRLLRRSVVLLLLGMALLVAVGTSQEVQARSSDNQPASTKQPELPQGKQPNEPDAYVPNDYIASLEASASDRDTNPESVSVARVLTSLVIVVGLVYLTMVFLRRYGGVGNAQTQEQRLMRVVGNLSLGPGRALHLVEVGSRKLVVGSTATNVTMLAELTESDLPSASTDTPIEQRFGGGSFKDHLVQFLGTACQNIESSKRVAHILRDSAAFIQGKRLSLAELRWRLRNG